MRCETYFYVSASTEVVLSSASYIFMCLNAVNVRWNLISLTRFGMCAEAFQIYIRSSERNRDLDVFKILEVSSICEPSL